MHDNARASGAHTACLAIPQAAMEHVRRGTYVRILRQYILYHPSSGAKFSFATYQQIESECRTEVYMFQMCQYGQFEKQRQYFSI